MVSRLEFLRQILCCHVRIPLPSQQEFAESIAKLFFRVCVGRGGRQRQRILICYAVFDAGLRQVQQRSIGIVGIKEHEAVDGNAVGGPIAHQHRSMPVQNLSSGSGHRQAIGSGAGAAIGIFLVFRQLKAKQPEYINYSHKADQKHHKASAKAIDSIHGILQSERYGPTRSKTTGTGSGLPPFPAKTP